MSRDLAQQLGRGSTLGAVLTARFLFLLGLEEVPQGQETTDVFFFFLFDESLLK